MLYPSIDIYTRILYAFYDIILYTYVICNGGLVDTS